MADQTTKVLDAAKAGAGSTADGRPRRLGRGLSSLMGDLRPVSVSVASASAAPAEAGPLDEVGGGSPVVAASTRVGEATPVGSGSAALAGAGGAGGWPEGARLVRIAVEHLVASPFQPRRRFDEAALAGLAASIKSAGVMQPILVRAAPGAEGARYELIAGERRWRAAQLAGLAEVPALVVRVGDEEAAEHALIENMQREDLSALERAAALANLVARFGLTHAAVGERLGLDRATVTNLIRLNELEPGVQALLESGELSASHGKALLACPAGPGREALARRAAEQGWSVRRLERAAGKGAEVGAGEVVGSATMTAGVATAGGLEAALTRQTRRLVAADLARALSEYLGTKVEIRTDVRGTRGRIMVSFYDLDQFEGVVGKMGLSVRH